MSSKATVACPSTSWPPSGINNRSRCCTPCKHPQTRSESMKPQANEVVLITGCGSGIGKALALAFHRQGFSVCATARRIDTMQDLAEEGILTLALDVTRGEDIRS